MSRLINWFLVRRAIKRAKVPAWLIEMTETIEVKK